MSDDYDGNESLSRKLTEDETRELRIVLLPYFHASGEVGVEDITDFLDYTFAMISNSKTVEYVVKELIGMEMDFCPEEVAHKVGKEISTFLNQLNNGGCSSENAEGSKHDGEQGGEQKSPRVVSLKKSEDRGNALTMAGALGASREGGRNNKKTNKVEKKDNIKSDHKEKDRGGGNQKERREDRRGGHGGGRSSRQSEAFDRLSRPRNDSRRRDDDYDGHGRGSGQGDRGGRGGRGGFERGSRGGRGGRDGRFLGRGDRIGGNQRSRDDFEEEPRGRGRGRGRGRRNGPNKRARYNDYDEGDGNYDQGYGGYYDEDYEQGYGYGRGYDGRGRGRGRGGRGRGRGRNNSGEDEPKANGANEGGAGAAAGGDATNHPSPMVQANFSGGYGRFGGRGRWSRGGRGRGRFPGRADVVNMIQSKTWVRSKATEGDAGGDKSAPAESEG